MNSNKIIQEDLETIYQSDINWDVFKNCTILVTGANGFLPAYIVESLLYLNQADPNNNVTVWALVRNLENAKRRFSDYYGNPNLKFIVQDVTKSINIDSKFDYIIHAASQASPKYYGADPVGTLSANVTGTLNLMDLAVRSNVRSFLYFSSSEVYGEVDSLKMPIAEDVFGYLNPTNLRSCYSESKRMGENICVSYYHQYGVPAKIVRPFHTYGPGMRLDDGRVYADFVSDILACRDIKLKSDGSAIRAFCYLSDAVIGFFKVLINGLNGEAYNVGNPFQEFSILEIAEIIVKIFPETNLRVDRKETVESGSYLKSDIKRNSPDISKMSNLNWVPVVGVAEGFERTILSYKQA